MKKYFWHNKTTLVVGFLFVLLSGWWVSFQSTAQDGGRNVELFTASYGLIALIGAVAGIYVAKLWGGFKTIVGRAILMLSFGLLLQEFGQLTYSFYYHVLHTEVPYPSIGDVGFFGSIPLYIYGILLLSKASGTRFGLTAWRNKLIAVTIPTLILIVSYSMFLRGYEFDWSNPLTVFLDFGYPLGQAIYIALAINTYILSFNYLGGIMRRVILFVLFALLVQYVADFTFLYQVSHETWYAGGLNDYFYLIAYFLMTVGVLRFRAVFNKLKPGTSKTQLTEEQA